MTDGQQEGDGERKHHMKTNIKRSFEWTRVKSQILSPSLLKQSFQSQGPHSCMAHMWSH